MTGTIVFSIDAELAWGVHDLYPLTEAQQRRVHQARDNWETLLRLFEAYGIPATWAVVGHLLTSDFEYRDEYLYSSSWFEHADQGMRTQPENWLGTDLVEAVDEASVNNELASHGFTHAVFTEIPENIAVAECKLARDIGAAHDIEFTSFIFPRNCIAHRSVLADHGFTCYRGRRADLQEGISGIRGLRMLLGSVTELTTPETVTPTVDEHGLVNIPASLFLGGFRGHPWNAVSRLKRDPGITLARRGIDRASENGELFHMWLHPHDLTDERYVERIKHILDYVSMKESRDEILVRTMGDVAAQVRGGDIPPASQSDHQGNLVK